MSTIGKPIEKVKEIISDIINKDDHTALQHFFIEELRDIYWAEMALVKALPKMAKAATSTQLKTAFTNHLAVTETHVTRLERIFEMLEVKASSKKCEAMNGLIEEANGIIADTRSGTMVRDTALIFAAQKVEHYEIATYGCLKAIAGKLKLKKEIFTTLVSTLNDEKETDVLLTSIAEASVNEEASKE
jgi:ferritin-like metal-binding protein YciE